MKNKVVIFVFFVLVFVLGFVGYSTFGPNKFSFETSIEDPEETVGYPFQEMTIDYLRKRNFSSRLGDLKEYKKGDGYVSYLTSYDSDGLKINSLITVPDGDMNTKHPAIVFVHGYIAPTIYKTTERYVEYVDYLARNGYVVLKIDLRGHGSSEGEATGSYYSGDYVIDTINAVKALENADFVDKNNIGLWGHSMAGNITLRTAAVLKNIPAVAIWAGAGFTYTDLLEYRISDNSYRPPQQSSDRAKRREELRNTYGDFDPNSEFWSKVAPTNYLKDLEGALSLYHSVDDSVVSVEYSRNLKTLLDSFSVNSEYYEFKTGGHNISGNAFTQAMDLTLKFYDKNLKG